MLSAGYCYQKARGPKVIIISGFHCILHVLCCRLIMCYILFFLIAHIFVNNILLHCSNCCYMFPLMGAFFNVYILSYVSLTMHLGIILVNNQLDADRHTRQSPTQSDIYQMMY